MNARTTPFLPQGIHDITADEYHQDPAPEPSLSNSLIKALLTQTPRHAWLKHPRLNPQWKPDLGAQKFDLGTCAHALLLQGLDAAHVVDADDWKTKAAREERDIARADGKVPMLANQHAAVADMVLAAHAYIDTTSLRGIFNRGAGEQAVIFRDGTGVWGRVLIDWLTDDRSLILDYKTTTAEGPAAWMRSFMLQHGYDTQAVWYPRALAEVGHRGARFLFLVQETFAPFMCYLVEPAESMLELAHHKLARALPLWRDCLGSNRWPGYSTEVHQAEAPVWALREEELA